MEVELGSRPFGSGSTEHLLLQAAVAAAADDDDDDVHYEADVGFFADSL